VEVSSFPHSLQIESSSNASSIWTDPEGNTQHGNQVSATIPGHYTLKIIQGECIAHHNFTLTTLNKTIDVFELSPNPTIDGFFNVKASFFHKTSSRLTVSDLSGSVHLQKEFSIDTQVDYFDNLPSSGSYLITLQADNDIETTNLIYLP